MCQARSSCLATPALQRSMNIECWVPNVWMNKWIVSSECCRQAHLSFWQAEKLNTHTQREGQEQLVRSGYPWHILSLGKSTQAKVLSALPYIHTYSHIDCLRLRYICDRLSSIVERWLALEFHGESNTARHIDGMCQGMFFLFLSSPSPPPLSVLFRSLAIVASPFFNVIFLQFRSFRLVLWPLLYFISIGIGAALATSAREQLPGEHMKCHLCFMFLLTVVYNYRLAGATVCSSSYAPGSASRAPQRSCLSWNIVIVGSFCSWLSQLQSIAKLS